MLAPTRLCKVNMLRVLHMYQCLTTMRFRITVHLLCSTGPDIVCGAGVRCRPEPTPLAYPDGTPDAAQLPEHDARRGRLLAARRHVHHAVPGARLRVLPAEALLVRALSAISGLQDLLLSPRAQAGGMAEIYEVEVVLARISSSLTTVPALEPQYEATSVYILNGAHPCTLNAHSSWTVTSYLITASYSPYIKYPFHEYLICTNLGGHPSVPNENSNLQWGRRRESTYARAALLFFVVAFLTFMSIAAFPAFVEDMRVRGAYVWPAVLRSRIARLFGRGLGLGSRVP